MKLIEKNTFGDDTFYILEMDAQDKEAISEHVGNVNGSYINRYRNYKRNNY